MMLRQIRSPITFLCEKGKGVAIPKESNRLALNQETLRRLTGTLVAGSRSDTETFGTGSGSQFFCTISCPATVCHP